MAQANLSPASVLLPPSTVATTATPTPGTRGNPGNKKAKKAAIGDVATEKQRGGVGKAKASWLKPTQLSKPVILGRCGGRGAGPGECTGAVGAKAGV